MRNINPKMPWWTENIIQKFCKYRSRQGHTLVRETRKYQMHIQVPLIWFYTSSQCMSSMWPQEHDFHLGQFIPLSFSIGCPPWKSIVFWCNLNDFYVHVETYANIQLGGAAIPIGVYQVKNQKFHDFESIFTIFLQYSWICTCVRSQWFGVGGATDNRKRQGNVTYTIHLYIKGIPVVVESTTFYKSMIGI